MRLVIGTPGGSRIFTSIFQGMSDLYFFKLPLQEVLPQMGLHHQLLPPNVNFCETYAPTEGKLAQQLTSMEYKLPRQDFEGNIETIKIDADRGEPAADSRGRAKGHAQFSKRREEFPALDRRLTPF